MTVDLSELKVGDTVEFTDDTRQQVKYYGKSLRGPNIYSVNGYEYFVNGVCCHHKCTDIVEIIPKESEVKNPTKDSTEEFVKELQRLSGDLPMAAAGPLDPTVREKLRRRLQVDTTKLTKTATELVTKPKRFVDLLAEGEEYIECSQNIYKVTSVSCAIWLENDKEWVKLTAICHTNLFQPATPAQNPEKKRKVKYQIVFKDVTGHYQISKHKYENQDEFEKSHNARYHKFVHLIEESREEIEE